MKTKRLLIASLSLAMALLAAAASAEAIPFDVELGYRWTHIGGNEDMYRTQINEEDGLLLRSFTLTTIGTGLFEHVRVDASDLGAGPAGSLRVEAGSPLYRFNLRYRQADAFSALPRHANPFADQGIIPGQHTFDRQRDMLDLDLEFLPGRKIAPFVGYSFNQYDGPGQTTYVVGGDEFRLNSDLDEKDSEIRAGVGLNFGWMYGQITQGWRDFSSDERLTLIAGTGAGNNPGSVLGRPLNATEITRNGSIDGETPFTNAYAVFEPVNKLRIIANFIQSDADADGNETESAAGSFLSFPLGVFFDRLTENVVSQADTDMTRYGARFEYDLTPNVDLLAGYRSEEWEMNGNAALQSAFFNAVTFGGVNRGNIQDLLDAESSLSRENQIFDVGVQARAFGPLALRVAYINTSQDVDYSPDLEEIVIPGGQSGDFDRSIDTLDTSLTFAQSGFMFGAAYRVDSADDPILRTDFLDQQRTRVRAGYRTSNNFFHAGLTAERIESDNDREGIGYDSEVEQFSGDVEIAPIQPLRFRASYTIFDAHSVVSILRPETLTVDLSRHREDGRSIEGGVSLLLDKLSIDADYATFDNEGTLPFTVIRWSGRVVYDFLQNFGVAAEFNHDDYEETDFNLADFDADRIGLFLRWRP